VGAIATTTHSTPSAVERVKAGYEDAYGRSRMFHLRVLNVSVLSRVQPWKSVMDAAFPVCDAKA
jgi:hypothetical protein